MKPEMKPTPKQNAQRIEQNAQTLARVNVILESHAKHLQIANSEMAEVKLHLENLKTDVSWIKDILNKTDTRVWLILATIILGTLIQIVLRFYA